MTPEHRFGRQWGIPTSCHQMCGTRRFLVHPPSRRSGPFSSCTQILLSSSFSGPVKRPDRSESLWAREELHEGVKFTKQKRASHSARIIFCSLVNWLFPLSSSRERICWNSSMVSSSWSSRVKKNSNRPNGSAPQPKDLFSLLIYLTKSKAKSSFIYSKYLI